jgi:phage baseplate assembly protein W
MAKQKFLGLQYPLVKTPRGILAQKRGVDQIKADLLQLLLTNPGERVMMPTFGTPLRQLIFEPNDSTLTARAKKMIVDSILTWEPRIVISDIEVSSSIDKQSLNEFDSYEEKEAILYIRIKFIDPENIQTVEELVLESPIGG